MQVGRRGELQEWLDDWDQREASHRHISHLYGVYPGAQISPRATPELAEASRRVLDQRGLVGQRVVVGVEGGRVGAAAGTATGRWRT